MLFVNAGTTNRDPTQTIGEVSTDEFVHLMITNALSPMRVIERLQHTRHGKGSDRGDVVRARQRRQQRKRPAGALSRQQGGPEHVHAQLRGAPGRDGAGRWR